jgi:hypothetical protein
MAFLLSPYCLIFSLIWQVAFPEVISFDRKNRISVNKQSWAHRSYKQSERSKAMSDL